MLAALTTDGAWLRVKDGDPRAVAIYRRHYSVDLRYDHSKGIGGPGSRMVLLTPGCDALFVWRLRPRGLALNTNGYDDGQRGVMCSVFRNEGLRLSSELIREASERAWVKWPRERLFTYVDAEKIASANPGYCFKQAGWQHCGRTKGGLDILELTPLCAPGGKP